MKSTSLECPKSTRLHNEMDVREGKTNIACGLSKQPGHNRRSCKNRNLASLASLPLTFPLIQHCCFDALIFQLAPDELVSHMGRGLELDTILKLVPKTVPKTVPTSKNSVPWKLIETCIFFIVRLHLLMELLSIY